MGETANLPRVGCGAALLRGDKLLLIRRAKDPEAGCWGLPGGKVDPFETVGDAVRREIFEELGVRIVDEQLLCLVDQIDEPRGEHWFGPVFLARAFTGEPAIREPEKHTDLGWFALATLPGPLTVAAQQALRKLEAGDC